jgi:hypothetical protein
VKEEEVLVGWGRRRRRGYSKQKAMNEVDAGCDRATPASVRHDDDEVEGSVLAPPSSNTNPRVYRATFTPQSTVPDDAEAGQAAI